MTNDIVDEINAILGLDFSNIPEDAITAEEYGDSVNRGTAWAHSLLRKGYKEGKLDRAKGRNGKFYYWPKTV